MKIYTWAGTVLVAFTIAMVCQPVDLFARPGGGRPSGGARPSGELDLVHLVGRRPLRDPHLVGPHPLRGPHRVVLRHLPSRQQDRGHHRAVIYGKIFRQSQQEIYLVRPARLQRVDFPEKHLGP